MNTPTILLVSGSVPLRSSIYVNMHDTLPKSVDAFIQSDMWYAWENLRPSLEDRDVYHGRILMTAESVYNLMGTVQEQYLPKGVSSTDWNSWRKDIRALLELADGVMINVQD